MTDEGGEGNVPARWGSPPVPKKRRFYIEGNLNENMDFGDIAELNVDFPFNESGTVDVIGHWFSANKDERIGATWFEDLGYWIATQKICPDTGPESPAPYSPDGGGPPPGLGCTCGYVQYQWTGTYWSVVFSNCTGDCVPPATPIDPPAPGQIFRYECCVDMGP